MESHFLKTNPSLLIYSLLYRNILKRGDSIYEKVKEDVKTFGFYRLFKVLQERHRQFQDFQVFQCL